MKMITTNEAHSPHFQARTLSCRSSLRLDKVSRAHLAAKQTIHDPHQWSIGIYHQVLLQQPTTLVHFLKMAERDSLAHRTLEEM